MTEVCGLRKTSGRGWCRGFLSSFGRLGPGIFGSRDSRALRMCRGNFRDLDSTIRRHAPRSDSIFSRPRLNFSRGSIRFFPPSEKTRCFRTPFCLANWIPLVSTFTPNSDFPIRSYVFHAKARNSYFFIKLKLDFSDLILGKLGMFV